MTSPRRLHFSHEDTVIVIDSLRSARDFDSGPKRGDKMSDYGLSPSKAYDGLGELSKIIISAIGIGYMLFFFKDLPFVEVVR